MDIRKISVGANYKEAMHYIVGQPVIGGEYEIHLIKFHEEIDSFRIWISNDGGGDTAMERVQGHANFNRVQHKLLK
jgi:hypothetical protein